VSKGLLSKGVVSKPPGWLFIVLTHGGLPRCAIPERSGSG
jgi:hypothetical protein